MAGLDGTVKLPAFGEVKKKELVIMGSVVGGIVGVAYYRKRKADAAALAALPDSGTGALDQNAFGDTTPVGPGGSAVLPDGSVPPPQIINPQSPGITSNADWVQAAGQIDLGGVPADTITQAMVKIIGGTPVTQDQIELWNEVTGIIGFPPQGYKPPKLAPTAPPPPPPSGGGTTTKTHTYVSTGKYGLKAGHPVDAEYLIGLGYLTRKGTQLVFTGRGGSPKGHPFSYTYATGIGFLRRTS